MGGDVARSPPCRPLLRGGADWAHRGREAAYKAACCLPPSRLSLTVPLVEARLNHFGPGHCVDGTSILRPLASRKRRLKRLSSPRFKQGERPMRKIIVGAMVSMAGVMQSPAGPTEDR